MPTYTLIPDEHDFEPEEMVAEGPARLLAMVYDCGWNSAQVLQDGRFVFIVSRNVGGVWSILPGLPDIQDRSTVAAAGK